MEDYENATGQKINREKSFFITSKRCTLAKSRVFAALTGMKSGSVPFLYLGCNLFKGRAKASYFQYVLDKMEGRFSSFLWGSKEGQAKRVWRSWRGISFPTVENGVGVRSLRDIFAAFSLKLWWKYREGVSLWAQ